MPLEIKVMNNQKLNSVKSHVVTEIPHFPLRKPINCLKFLTGLINSSYKILAIIIYSSSITVLCYFALFMPFLLSQSANHFLMQIVFKSFTLGNKKFSKSSKHHGLLICPYNVWTSSSYENRNPDFTLVLPRWGTQTDLLFSSECFNLLPFSVCNLLAKHA